jgi:hypothetical protein
MIASQLSEPVLGSGIAEIRLAGLTAVLRLSLRTVPRAGNAVIETPERPAPAPPGPVPAPGEQFCSALRSTTAHCFLFTALTAWRRRGGNKVGAHSSIISFAAGKVVGSISSDSTSDSRVTAKCRRSHPNEPRRTAAVTTVASANMAVLDAPWCSGSADKDRPEDCGGRRKSCRVRSLG